MENPLSPENSISDTQSDSRSGFSFGSGKKTKLILLLVTALIPGVAMLACGVFFAYTIIRNNVLSTSLTLPLLKEAAVSNHIAFSGNDSNLWVVSPDGTGLRQITGDGKGYRFPTWAPDGRHLAFIGPDQENRSALYISPAGRSDPTVIYQKPNSPPFYLYWAPDSSVITFLTQETASLAMRMVATQGPNTQRILGKGAPFYWVWSPQSDKMLLHVGGSRALSNKAHISILHNNQEARRVDLNLAPGRFQTPVWSADGAHIYYIASNETRDEAIYKTNAQTLEQEKVTDLDGFAHLVLSPNNKWVAYLQMERGISPPFGKAYLVDVDGKNQKQIIKSPVASIYWSPNGKKLALLGLSRTQDGPTAKTEGLASPLPQKILLRWWIYDVDADKLEPAITFTPTNDFLQTIPYFDQYHLSLTFWSPNSRYFVVTKSKDDKIRDGTVWVVDTTGQEEPRQVGEGSLAVWSWQ